MINMISTTFKQFLHILIILLSVTILLTSAQASQEDQPCTRMKSQCRLTTTRAILQGYQFTKLNISCFCEDDEPEDVLDHLDALATMKCSWLPVEETSPSVNLSTIHITGCLVQKRVFPLSILQLARRSDHLEIIMNKCPKMRLEGIMQKLKHVPVINVSLKDSTLSGLPRGWLAETKELQVKVENCRIPVMESKAIMGFEQDAKVTIEIINSSISTIKMVAFELPPRGSLTIRGGAVLALDQSAYSGGSKVDLEGVKIGRFLGGALNLHGVTSFRMSSCTVAEMYAEAFIDQEKGGNVRGPQSMSERTALIEHNKIVTANGDTFVNLCKFSSLTWINNTFLDVTQPPLRLQQDYCPTQRNWKETVRLTGLNCTNCQSFANPNEQNCAVYQSAYCTSCNLNDNCNVPLLGYLIQSNCKSSHPDIISSLTEVCKFDPSAPQKTPRSYNGGNFISENPFIVLISMMLLMVRHCL